MRIEQLLHGYDNGHRLLAGSVLLKNNTEMDLIATMSDWSEYVAPDGGESSYVTAYSLQESGYYVIAKTWYADEMKRPGCVWTHSLLIPFDILNHLDDFKRLTNLFKRPSLDGCLDEYSRTIEYENKNYSADDYKPVSVDRKIESSVLQIFLNNGNDAVVFEPQRDNKLLEEALLAVMNTLPQQILQRISWCTGTAYIRKLNGLPLTCQFVSRSNNTQTDSSLTEEKWQTYVLDAVMRGDVNQGQLIRMFAEDIGVSEKNYAAIVSVLFTLEDYFKTGGDSESRFKEVLRIIGNVFPKTEEGVVIKKLCANKAFTSRYCTDQKFFLFFATLPLDNVFDETETKIDERWNGFIENRRKEYVPLLGNICKSGSVNAWGVNVLKASVDIFSSDEVAEIIKGNFHLFNSIVLVNPKILDRVQWMILTPQEIESILPLILDSRTDRGFTHWARLFAIMLEYGVEINGQLAEKIFENSDEATSILLDYVNRDAVRYVNHVLGKQIEKKPKQILKWLRNVDEITDRTAYAIVNAVNEYSMPVKAAGPKLWTPFLKLQFHDLRTEVYTFLFSLSFNWPLDKDAIELMRMAFYPIHELEAKGNLGYSYWSRITGNLESVMFWEEWDKCKKLRKTVVKRLKMAGYDKSMLANFTPDIELNEMLMKMW